MHWYCLHGAISFNVSLNIKYSIVLQTWNYNEIFPLVTCDLFPLYKYNLQCHCVINGGWQSFQLDTITNFAAVSKTVIKFLLGFGLVGSFQRVSKVISGNIWIIWPVINFIYFTILAQNILMKLCSHQYCKKTWLFLNFFQKSSSVVT